MTRITRREAIKRSVAGGVLLGMQTPGPSGTPGVRAQEANSEVRIAIIGCGGVDTPGGVGGRGRQLMGAIRDVPGIRTVALCDVDEAVLEHEVAEQQKRGERVKAYGDLRRVFDDPNIDAVAVATPNHWHCLATIWACQAGKAVYVEKPFSHNIWEGRQAVAAAGNERVVQVGMQSRSSEVLRESFEYLQGGALGAIRCAYAIVYRSRGGIGTVDGPTPVSDSVNYDLWSGPAPMSPLMRNQLHYEWHWFWETGNGEIGNNGIHSIDVARWGLGQNQPPRRAMSIGGRFGPQDAAETPNTQIAIMDYDPAPLICEIRNLGSRSDIGSFKGIGSGVVIQCENGYWTGSSGGGTAFDNQGTPIKEFRGERRGSDSVVSHMANFAEAVRSGNPSLVNAPARDGHLSATCFHMANISHRVGQLRAPDEILEITKGNAEMSDAFGRCREHLAANGVNLDTSPAVVGPWVTLEPDQERFEGEFADAANALARREYREPFVVPKLA